MKFENIKVGDIVFVKHDLAYSFGWSGSKFRESFYLGYRVIKVTKTQFTAQFQKFEFRFKKDGVGFGCDKVAFAAGEIDRSNGKVIGKCQYRDYLNHAAQLKILRSADVLDIKINDCKTIETALKVSELLERAAKLIEVQ